MVVSVDGRLVVVVVADVVGDSLFVVVGCKGVGLRCIIESLGSLGSLLQEGRLWTALSPASWLGSLSWLFVVDCRWLLSC